jgi:hypothetical protein
MSTTNLRNRSSGLSTPPALSLRDRTLPRSEMLLAVGTGLGLLHHLDHVLRADHSGWPFSPEVTPFTFSLLIYPIMVGVYLARSQPWLRVAGTALVLVAVLLAHTLIETPGDQFGVWATGASSEPYALGQTHLLQVQSPALGILAVIISTLVSLALALALAGFIRDALRARAN